MQVAPLFQLTSRPLPLFNGMRSSQLREFLTRDSKGQLSRSRSLLARLILVPLRLLSVPYWIGAQSKNFLYDSGFRKPFRCPIPTVSIGNLSVGGTGKSPAVHWVAGLLQERLAHVAILSRGYQKLESGLNDEALEMKRLLPNVLHLQSSDRVAIAREAFENHDTDVLLLDDGFQHRRLARDLDIVLMDATDPANLRRVLPAGLYREPISNLSRAQVIILTRVDQVEEKQLKDLISCNSTACA